MARDAVPVIEGLLGRFGEKTDDVIRELQNNVSFIRGLGDSGRKIDVVRRESICCGSEMFIRERCYSPEPFDTVAYYCTNPACDYYHRDEFRYAIPRLRDSVEPMKKDYPEPPY